VARPARRGRALTIIAVGVLSLDGVLLLAAGLWSHRSILLAMGAVMLVLAVGVYFLWRRQVRVLDEIAQAKAEVRAEVKAMQGMLKEKRRNE
jgi:type III secretory pathway component EscU